MGPRIIQHDNLDREPRSPAAPIGDHSWSRQQRRAFDWRGIGVIAAFLLIVLLFVTLRYDRRFFEWVQYGGGSWIVYVLIGAAVLAYLKWWLLVEQPGGYRVMWLQISNRRIGAAVDAQMIAEGMIKAQQFEAQRMFAEARQLTLTQTPDMPMLDSGVVDGELVPEDDAIGLVPDSEWRGWLTEMPHTMIAGGTGTGKTTLARIELHERLSQGYAGIVLDPKGKDWYSLPVFGGGRKFDEILAMLDSIHGEMAARFEAYGKGERQFDPIKVLVDEVPDIMDACLDMRRRMVDGRWSRFSRQLGSLAREIGISVTLMTQSPLVEDIGMNSAMRKNFTRIALGDEVPILIRMERDNKRRPQLQELMRGQRYPAALLRHGTVHLLDTSNVLTLSQRQIARPLGWHGTQPIARPVVSAAAKADSAVATSIAVPGAIVYPPQVRSKNGRIAFLLKQKYSYRFIEDELNVSHQTISQVKKAMGI